MTLFDIEPDHTPVTTEELRAWRTGVADQLADMVADDNFRHRWDEHRRCIAELDAWISEVAKVTATPAHTIDEPNDAHPDERTAP